MSTTFPSFFNTRFILALFLISTLVFATPALAAVTITVTTDKDTYSAGETVSVSGTTVPDSAVTVVLINPDGTAVAIAQTTSDSEGKYQAEFKFPDTIPFGNYKYGTYTVKAYLSIAGVLKASASKEITLAPPVGIGLRVSWISAPDFVRGGSDAVFSINVTYDGEPVPDAEITATMSKISVEGEVKEVESVEFEYVGDGEYKYVFSAPNADALYKLDASISYAGDTETVSKKFYTLFSYQASVESIEESVSSLESTVSTLRETVESLSSSVDNLQTTVSSLQTTVSNLQSTIAAMPSAEDLAALQNSVAALSAQLPALYGLSIIAIIIAIAAIVLLYRKVVK